MALLEYRITDSGYEQYDKVKVAIERIKAFEPAEGYWLAYSGGKDSTVCKALMEMSGVKYQAHYSCTSVDPPELVRFIKSQPDVSFDIPHYPDGKPITMWNLIPKYQMPPTRIARYCCKILKESSGVGYVTVTGVRWAESKRRKVSQGLVSIYGDKKKNSIILNYDDDETRRMAEHCYRTRKTLLNPIIDWTDDDVWEFIRGYRIPYCSLYDCAYKKLTRLGCIGCPMGATREEELNAYPKYKASYIRAFEKMIKTMTNPPATWKTGEDVMEWWLQKKKKPDENQILMDFEEQSE